MDISLHNAAEQVDSGKKAPLKLYKSIIFTKKQKGYLVVKRVLDVVFAGLLLILLSPAFLLIALTIKLTSSGPVLFRQERMGQYGKPILIYKFRTMYRDAPNVATAELSDPDQYITPVGRLLRATSMDELPQLLNILKGNMAFIGPRPLILSETGIHTSRLQEGVYFLRPGLTGLAQVNGRDLVSPEHKVAYDVEYLHTFGWKQDFSILFRTVAAVWKRDGIAEGTQTEFKVEPETVESAEPIKVTEENYDQVP